MLTARGWAVEPEVTFAIDGERGSVDILAFHEPTATLLVIEVKSVVPDVQASLAAVDRKVRLAYRLAAQRGWPARRIATLFVVGATRTGRRRVEAHQAIFAARFPDRFAAIRRFLADPGWGEPIRGLWFLPFRTTATARHCAGRARRAA
jgi:hypothetical protein